MKGIAKAPAVCFADGNFRFIYFEIYLRRTPHAAGYAFQLPDNEPPSLSGQACELWLQVSRVGEMTMEQRTSGTPTVERILQSAETEFAENGFATGRIQEIATNAGVTKQLVYHYFQNKEELYQQVLERISDQYDDLFNSKDYDDLTSEAAIRQFVCRHFQLHAGNGGNLLRDVAMHSGEVLHLSRRRHQLVKAVHDCLDRIVVRGREERVFNDRQDTSELLLMINIITNGAVATGPALIGIMAPDLPSCPKRKALEDLSARFILSALTH